MSNYSTIRDITRSNARRLEDVEPDLAVFNVDHTKSYMPLATKSSKFATASVDELLRKKLSVALSIDFLEKTGWGNGMRLPFANKENQELEKLLELRQRKFLLLQTELRDNVEHLEMIEQNFTRASEDIVTYQNFLGSKKKQIEEEKNLAGISERFYNKVVQEKQTAVKALKECRNRCSRMHSNQEKRLKNLCELRDLIEFDREALQEYHLRLKNYQNQKFELGRLITEDSKTIEQIDKTYVELGAKRKVLKMELDQEAMTTAKCQEQLDRLSVEFRKVYRHRQEMITLWSTNIETAKKKDTQMQYVADEYFDLREKMREMNSEMEYREKQYRSVQCGIRSSQLQISELDKKLSELRRAMQQFKGVVTQFQDGVLEIQLDIRAASLERKSFIARTAQLEAELAEINDKLQKIKAVVDALYKQLAEVQGLQTNSVLHITELEKMLEDEVQKEDIYLREVELIRKYFWKRSNEKKQVSDDIFNIEMALQRLKGSLTGLEGKEFFNMEFLAKQSAKVYHLDLESSTIENKLSRAQNESVNPQFFTLQTRVAQLREDGRRLGEEKKYITKELSNLQYLITKNGSELVKNHEEKSKFSTRLLEINMVSQRTQKLIDQSDKQIQDLQVENSLESVNLKRLTDSMKYAREQLYGLSEERKTIYWAVKERKEEIENHRALNVSKSKALMEAVNKLKVHVQEMGGRTEKLKGRFDLVTKLMLGSQSAGTEEDTIAFKVRKAARERESLQLELRKWEARVEEAKRELAGLENVHKLMNASNLAVKETLAPIKDGSTESEELEILNQEEKSIHVRKSRALRFKAVLIDKIADLKQQMSVMGQETQATSQVARVKVAMGFKIENETIRQKEKIQRWNSLCCKLLKEIKASVTHVDFDSLQKDLKCKFLQEKLECAFVMLDRLLLAFPSLKPVVQEFFEKDQNLYSLMSRLTKPSSGTGLGVGRQLVSTGNYSPNPSAPPTASEISQKNLGPLSSTTESDPKSKSGSDKRSWETAGTPQGYYQ